MNHSAPSVTHRISQRGLTLVEVMVAITISLILLAGVMQIFISSRQTYRVQDALARIQENGRFAMDFLASDIRMADYWGCLKNRTALTNNLNAGGAGYNPTLHGFANGIEGTDGSTDSITLRMAEQTGLTLLSPFGPLASANIGVRPGNTLQQGDIVIVSDCTAGDIFQISNANPGGTGTIVHNTGNATSPGNFNPGACVGANAHCLSKIYQGDAQLMTTTVRRYFIQADATNNNAPTLYRQDQGDAAQPLAADVENMQILYGEDMNSPMDGSANRYVPAGAAGLVLANVVSVRLSLLVRSAENNITAQPQPYTFNGAAAITPADRRLRRVFTTTIRLRNRGL